MTDPPRERIANFIEFATLDRSAANEAAARLIAAGLVVPVADDGTSMRQLLVVFEDFDSIAEGMEHYQRLELARRCLAALRELEG